MEVLEQYPALFGVDPTSGIVSVEFSPPDRVQIYRRRGEETLLEEATHRPFVWTTNLWAEGAQELTGDGAFRYVISFNNASAFTSAKARHRKEILALNDLSHQYLLTSGRTLFKGMSFGDLRRLQVDIETFTPEGGGMSDASRHPLLAIAMTDSSGWEEILCVTTPDNPNEERALLEKFVALVQERNPDVIEGHNIFRFDLPYLETRARQLGIPLALGRDGSKPYSEASQLHIAERRIHYRKFKIHGRHIVDTLHLVLLHDVGTREMESFGLKAAARYFGVAEDERITLEAREITVTHAQNRERFEMYALQDVRETRALSAVLSPPWFIQTSIFPYNYQEVLARGNATRINSLFLREYLRQGQAIPAPPEPRPFSGGATDIFFSGVVRNIWHCDITSLYPSVILTFGLTPRTDVLELFSGMLSRLRDFRLEAKAKMRTATKDEKPHFEALQGAFKILINSFYGYLGFGQGNFADFDTAEAVTTKGREILNAMVQWLRQRGAEIVEIDTDGIYFVPPEGATWDGLYAELAATLPAGIEVEFDARYQAMFSYKAKNYALLGAGGELLLKGASLKSRSLEKFKRLFIERAVRALLEGHPEIIPAMHVEFATALRERRWEPDMFVKTETLHDSLEVYRTKVATSSRNRAARFELALRSKRPMQAGDRVVYYVTGNSKKVRLFENAKLLDDWVPQQRDENVPYYLAQLDDLAEKFENFIPPSATSDRLL